MTEDTAPSETEVLASKNLQSYTECFPVSTLRRSSSLNLEEFKAKLEKDLRKKSSSNLFLTQDSDDEEKEEKERTRAQERRKVLINQVWEKQYRHNMQSWYEAVEKVAEDIAADPNERTIG